jgi:hypothetical protein
MSGLNELEFDNFWSEPLKISLGVGNVTLKAETLGVIGASGLLGSTIWGIIGFRIFIPIGNIEVSWIGAVLCGAPLFGIYKLLTLNRSTAEVFESLVANLYKPKVEMAGGDVELVPILFIED